MNGFDYSEAPDEIKPYYYRLSPRIRDSKGRIRPSPLASRRHAKNPLTYTKNIDWSVPITAIEMFVSNTLNEFIHDNTETVVPMHIYHILESMSSLSIPAMDPQFTLLGDTMLIDRSSSSIVLNPYVLLCNFHSIFTYEPIKSTMTDLTRCYRGKTNTSCYYRALPLYGNNQESLVS